MYIHIRSAPGISRARAGRGGNVSKVSSKHESQQYLLIIIHSPLNDEAADNEVCLFGLKVKSGHDAKMKRRLPTGLT